jgi:membrane-bound lytic murein transglycosylase B
MARHRRIPHAKRAIRAVRNPTLTVAVIFPLMFASAVGATASRFPTPKTAMPATPITSVAAITAFDTDPHGPVVIAAEHPSTTLHTSVPTEAGPPSTVAVKSTEVLDIPPIALSAYRNAEQMMATSDPECGISWNLLAGIGRIESMHANGGATDARGTVVQPIYGPALDGTLPGNEVILESSVSGRATYARAMGPMQFLPGTWAQYAADGDGDGVADPQNIYDSTLAAARYLCSGGLNLRDQQQALTAILRYNNSMPYAQYVLGWAAAYANGIVPVDLPGPNGAVSPLGDRHLENPEGIGPGLPLNINGLPSTDPLAHLPLIDVGPR